VPEVKASNFTGNAPRDAWPRESFDLDCRDCTRLAGFLEGIRRARPDYHAHPVPPFGDPDARLLVVGLAPGMHGANRTGRPFTGDHAGILLYRTLHRFGFASHAGSSDPADGLSLTDCRVTNAVKCLPPQNKPMPAEITSCNRFLAAEMAHSLPRAVLALGRIAHAAVLRARGLKVGGYPFAHHAVHDLPGGLRLFDSYHCSRYNTQTKRLTETMFAAVVRDIAGFLAAAARRD
jgi:uracil-DNA glycosylase family 4